MLRVLNDALTAVDDVASAIIDDGAHVAPVVGFHINIETRNSTAWITLLYQHFFK